MNLTKKLLHASLLTSLLFTLSGCFNKTIEPRELTKVKEISIKGTSYIPEYKGLDPYLLADDEVVLGNKEIWYIHNEKLYLFADEDNKEQWFSSIRITNELATKKLKIITGPTEEEVFEDISDTFMNGSAH
ncbi:MAG TPA: hypothetical protein EYO73_09295 [Sulfurimonas sp.]|nr:hypothetical protein [Sulfurimonas sp.]